MEKLNKKINDIDKAISDFHQEFLQYIITNPITLLSSISNEKRNLYCIGSNGDLGFIINEITNNHIEISFEGSHYWYGNFDIYGDPISDTQNFNKIKTQIKIAWDKKEQMEK